MHIMRCDRLSWCAGELLIMRHNHEVRLVNAPAIVGESVLLNLLPTEQHVRPVTLRAIAPCVLWVLSIRDLDHIFQARPAPGDATRGQDLNVVHVVKPCHCMGVLYATRWRTSSCWACLRQQKREAPLPMHSFINLQMSLFL